jgi:DNA-binding MarR family transcriptional regulator
MTKRAGAKAARASAPDGLTDLACACATARQVARALTQLYDGHLRGTGLEAPQFALLMTLRKQGPCSQVALGRRYGLDKTTVSRNLKWLERQGWIAESRTASRRERQLWLTAAGEKQLATALPEWKRAQAQLRSAMTAGQWESMFRTFRTVARAAQNIRSARAPRARAS